MSEGSPSANNLGHGIRLSISEYDKRIVELHTGLPLSLSKEEETNLRRRELDLTIDYRLGQNFPQQRREALWAIQQQVEKKRLRMAFHWLFHFITYRWLYARANKLADYLVAEYAKVLTKEELQAYFDLRDGEHPTLPIDKL